MERTKQKPTANHPYVKKNLARFETLWLGLFLILLLLLFLLHGTVLSFLQDVRSVNNPDNVYTLRAAKGAWYLVGLLLSLGTTGIVMIHLYKGYLREKYKPNPYVNDYFSNRTFEGYGFVKVMAWSFATAALFFAVHLHGHSVAADKQTIAIHAFLHFREKRYPLKGIVALQCVQAATEDGDSVDTDYRIKFVDGYTFDTRDNMLADGRHLIRFLSLANNMAVDTLKRQ